MIVFVGVAGSGKSIQGRLLAQELKCDYFSMGQFLRSNVNEEVKEKMIKGDLINDAEVVHIIDVALARANTDKEYILDGFPRTQYQTDWLISQANSGNLHIKLVIHLKASAEVIVPRLLERKRPDDNMSAISLRLNEYNANIMPIINDFEKASVKIAEINAEETIERVHAQIMAAIKNL